MNRVLALAIAALAGCFQTEGNSVAAATPIADVWVSVTVTPNTFQPRSTGVIELTMHNNGPDTAGTDYSGSLGNVINQKGFLLTQPSEPPPYRVLPGATGCAIDGEVFGPNIHLLWGYVWEFYFPPIPAGESRTCHIPIQFNDQPLESIDTFWRIQTNPEDPDLTNNTVNYRFVISPQAQAAASVPSANTWTMAIAAFGLLAMAFRSLKSRSDPGF